MLGTVTLFQLSDKLTFSLMADEVAGIAAIFLAAIFVLTGVYHMAQGKQLTEGKGFSPVMYILAFVAAIFTAFAGSVVSLVTGFALVLVFVTLMLMKNKTEENPKVGMGFMIGSLVALVLVIAGYALMSSELSGMGFVAAGVFDIEGSLAGSELFKWAAGMVLLGYSIPACMAAFAGWKKDGMVSVPAATKIGAMVTCMYAGVMGIVRTLYFLIGSVVADNSAAKHIWMLLIVALMLVSVILAIREQNAVKRVTYLLASQIGNVIYGVTTFTGNGFIGTMLYMIGMTAVIAIVMMGMEYVTGKNDITLVSQMAGIGKKHPVVMWSMVLAALYIVGLPPFGGFISRWYTIMGSYNDGTLFLQLRLFAPAVMLLVLVFVMYGFMKMIVPAFFAKGEETETKSSEAAETKDEDADAPAATDKASKACGVVLVVLAAFLVVYSIYPMPLLTVLQIVASRLIL